MTVDPQVMLDLIRLKLNWLEQDGIVARLAIGETAPKAATLGRSSGCAGLERVGSLNVTTQPPGAVYTAKSTSNPVVEVRTYLSD